MPALCVRRGAIWPKTAQANRDTGGRSKVRNQTQALAQEVPECSPLVTLKAWCWTTAVEQFTEI